MGDGKPHQVKQKACFENQVNPFLCFMRNIFCKNTNLVKSSKEVIDDIHFGLAYGLKAKMIALHRGTFVTM